jgi:hypothetical protein
MIACVPTAQAISGGGDASPAGGLIELARRLRRRHQGQAAAASALRAALIGGGPLVVAIWVWPPVFAPALQLFVAGIAVAAAAGAWSRRRLPDAALLHEEYEPGRRTAVGDELATWLECARRGALGEPMVAWLARDVAQAVAATPPQRLRGLGRRRLGRLRWLVPVLVVLLLAWLLFAVFAPPWPGVLGGGAGGGGAGAGGQGPGAGAAGGTGGTGAQEPQPDQPTPWSEQPKVAPPRIPPPPSPPPEPDPPPQPVEPEPPAPLLDLPPDLQFMLPEFIGDGPTRRARVHAAELAESRGGRPPAAAAAAGAAAPRPDAPPQGREEFERAAEKALRARYVPPEERPIVRRFFERLREAAK